MAERYTVAIIGMGPRGVIHLHGLAHNADRFEVVGLCDRHPEKLQAAAGQYGIPADRLYTDAEAMMAARRPEVLAFVTMPHVRLELARLGVRYGVKGLMLEKPMANTLQEAAEITQLCAEKGIKAVVCQQHKYLRSFLRLREVLDSGALGKVYQVHAACQAQASQLGTHYLDYMMWANAGARARAVAGHIHGSFFLKDSHPAPDYTFAQIAYENGVRGIFECGYFAPQHAAHNTGFAHQGLPIEYWTDDRLTVYGERGYAWAECNGRYAAMLPGYAGPEGGDYGDFDKREQWDAQIPYTADYARWLDDDALVHSCNVATAYHGMETLQAVYLSALDHTRVDLPLAEDRFGELYGRMEKALARVPYGKF